MLRVFIKAIAFKCRAGKSTATSFKQFQYWKPDAGQILIGNLPCPIQSGDSLRVWNRCRDHQYNRQTVRHVGSVG